MAKTVLALIILVLFAAAVAGVVAWRRVNKNQGDVLGVTQKSPIYFSDTAKVKYFYSDLCGWCQKESEVLKELSAEGYKVRPMDVKAHPEFFEQYGITATPTFLAEDKNFLIGYQTKEKLKKFLDEKN
ncbi:thioredoxin family protein [Candidatus Berkelbacteria bacterium]|nr:thioredoxin family protein [Candidatus Berkelbacteria bacterium]MBI4029599.1 thioredoxin family protein [Candidatus Berkelbacteria bacterium]